MLNPHQMHSHAYDKGDHVVATKFAAELQKELGTFLREVIFFGSAARRSATLEAVYGHDIDVLVIIDDLKRPVTQELVEAYRIITENIANNTSTRLHINTLKISAFWEYLNQGDPIALNILRDGIPILETGFVKPLQALYARGQIRPSKENIHAYFLKAPQTIQGAKWHMLQATIDLYWAALDITHANLLMHDLVPNSPNQAYHMLSTHLAKQGFSRAHASLLKNLKQTTDKILDRSLKEISGKQYDQLHKATEEYLEFSKKWIADQKAKQVGAL